MARDFYVDAAAQRANMSELELAAAKTDLLTHRQNSDVESAAQSVQQIANLEAEKANLATLYQNYVASQQAPPPLTEEERHAKPWDKMTVDDAYQLARSGSRYGIDDNGFRRGLEEVQKRRLRGE